MSQTPSTEDFLYAARRAEIASLKQLEVSCDLVIRATELIHELQRERGLSNSFLVSSGTRFSRELQDEMSQIHAAEKHFRTMLGRLPLGDSSLNSSRLFSSVAFVLHGLDELPELRQQILAQKLTAAQTTGLFNRLVAGLIHVVFEAADISHDPDITRSLIALFNFVQGKEYSGQERAWGLIGFTSGEFSNKVQQRVKDLQEAQIRCFDIFTEFTQPVHADTLRRIESSEAATELEKLRQMIARARHGDSLPAAMSEIWYSVCTQRIDAMQLAEKALATSLQQLCEQKIKQAEEELTLHTEQIKSLLSAEEPPISPLSRDPDGDDLDGPVVNVAAGFNIKLAQSVSELVQGQAARIQQVSAELAEARQALDERKLVEKAKGLLMQSKGISEEEAYREIRQAAMNGKQRIVEVATHMIRVADMLLGEQQK